MFFLFVPFVVPDNWKRQIFLFADLQAAPDRFGELLVKLNATMLHHNSQLFNEAFCYNYVLFETVR